MKRDCPRLNVRNHGEKSPGASQQPKYSRSSSSPSGINKQLSDRQQNAHASGPKCNDQRGSDHIWGKGYRLGSGSGGASTGASRGVRSYSSVASNSSSKNTGEQAEKGADLSKRVHVSGDRQSEEKVDCKSQQALDETHYSIKDETSRQPSGSMQADLPLGDAQSDAGINGTHQLSGDSPKFNMSKDLSTSDIMREDTQHSKCDSSRQEEPCLHVAVVKQSVTTANQATEKRKRSHFPPFIDTHCHLDYVFDRYHHHGTFSDFTNRLTYPTNFEGCISTFCDPAAFSSLGAWRELLSEPNVWGTFGIHPHNAKYYHTKGLEDKVLEGLQHPKCVAFGEIGLDYSEHSPSDPQTQRDILRHQLQLVVPFGKPLLLHCRDAEQDLYEILTQHLPWDWLIHLHCFTGEPHVATQFLSKFPNLYLGVCGNVTNPRQANMRTTVCEVPLERLLIETDAPYHVPSNLPKAAGWCRNTHPALAFYVAKEIAKLRKEELVDVLKTVRTNTQTLYGV